MIDIVLATYNGATYLQAQINSIQENSDYASKVARLIIVDDGSSDATEQIVRSLMVADSKIEWFKNSSGKHGPSHNFSFGLTLTSANYIMLSDQDDIWLPDKISCSLAQIKALNTENPNLPLLVFSDKVIVDEKLNVICDSYFRLKNIPKDWHLSFTQLCQQNVVSGCTMLFNRALLNTAMPIPDDAYMHDWWLALVASRCGKITLIDKGLIQYRQHDNNSIGAKKRTYWGLVSSFKLHFTQFELSFLQIVAQAKAFQYFEKKQGLVKNETIASLANIHFLSKKSKVTLLLNKTLSRSGFLGRFVLLLTFLKLKTIPDIE